MVFPLVNVGHQVVDEYFALSLIESSLRVSIRFYTGGLASGVCYFVSRDPVKIRSRSAVTSVTHVEKLIFKSQNTQDMTDTKRLLQGGGV